MRRRIKYLSYLCCMFIAVSFTSCSLFDPASPVGSYIHIDSISVTTDYVSQGSNSKKITDAWVIYDNKYLGTFPLPADIPLIGEGNHNIIIKGGIMENGISGSRAAYPKYSSYTSDVNLTAGKSLVILPTISYGSAVQFPQLEDFDVASLSLIPTSTASVPLLITPLNDPNAFEGNSGWVVLDDNHTLFEVASSSAFSLPISIPTFVELNYKCESDFTIGVFINTSIGVVKSDLLNVRASATWKKIYAGISSLGGVATDGISYKVYIHAEKPTSQITSNLYFDNLKVVY